MQHQSQAQPHGTQVTTLAERYPLDFDALKKGSVVPAEQCERIVGLSRDHKKYSRYLLPLQQRIEKELERRGYPVTTKQEGYSIRILTDSEATEYNEWSKECGIRRIKRSFQKQLQVDLANLTAAERREHERRVLSHGKTIQALKDTKKQLKVESHRNNGKAIEE